MTQRVSVVVPSYNNAAFIEQTIESILGQTFTDFELVIADHSSTDGTWDRLQRFAADPRVRLMRTPPGGGAPANWTAVTAAATAPLIKLVCGDDVLYPTALAEQVAAFDQHPQAVLVAARRDVVDADGHVLFAARGLPGMDGLLPGPLALRRTVRAGTNVFGEPMCVLMKRETLAGAGGWDDRWPYLIDQASYAQVLRHGPMVSLPTPLAAFRVSDHQWSVGLARRQAAHARAFHRTIAQELPEWISRWDRMIGDIRATALAVARRGVYFWLDRRRGKGRRPEAVRTMDKLEG